MRISYIPGIIALALAPSIAHAATCEESFSKKGNPVTGTKYLAEVTVEGVNPQAALAQIRGAASAKGYDILADESANGSLLIEKPKSFGSSAEKTIVEAVQSGSSTTISMYTKLGGGNFTSADKKRAEYCALLNSVQGGKAGIAAARAGQNSVNVALPRTVDAALLTQELAEEGEKNPEAVNARYKDKVFIIKGYLARISNNNGITRVYFKTPRSTNELTFYRGRFRFLPTISCIVAPGQSTYILALDVGAKIKMKGTFDTYNHLRHSFALDACAAA
jgi:hypothetical protein